MLLFHILKNASIKVAHSSKISYHTEFQDRTLSVVNIPPPQYSAHQSYWCYLRKKLQIREYNCCSGMVPVDVTLTPKIVDEI
jgi:hypothetical protein